MVHDVSTFAGFSSSNSLFKAFVSPFAATAGQVGNAYAASLIAPPQQTAPPPEPPTLYLPSPKPVSLDTSWTETGHIVFTWISMTSLALGVGVVLGLASSTCIGKRELNEQSSSPSASENESEESLSLQSDDPEKQLKQTIIRNI